MKRSLSLRKQLFGLMALLVLLQSCGLVLALSISRVFTMLDAEAFRLFENTTSTRAETYNASVSRLIENMADETQALASRIQRIASGRKVSEQALYLDDEAYLQITDTGTQSLLSLLSANDISGAFFVLNGSNVHKEDPDAHSAVYLRNSATGSSLDKTTNYLLEVGPIAVSQQHTIPTSINWQLDLSAPRDSEQTAYLQRPMEAAEQAPRAEMERYGYWSPPVDILGQGHSVVSYTMPLIGADDKPFGVLGIEISLALFGQQYLPNTNLPYQNSFYSIAHVQDNVIDLSWFIPSGPIAQVYLTQDASMSVQPVPTTNSFQTHIDGLGEMYCAVEPLVMYSQNSPFYEDSWALVGFVSRGILHETSSGVRTILVLSIAITTVLAFVAIFILIYVTTRKISGLSQYVRTLSPYADIRFTRTGILEIDELTSAVEKLNQSVINASKTTSKILELTLMPIGGYEISSENNYVVLTEYLYQLLHLPPGTEVSKEAWKSAHDRLIANPAQGYDNIYHYADDADGEEKWLRILEAPTETGLVGIVLDVSRDIEEHRRLAHELDYDALTHLYSRTAFKREAFRLVRKEPGQVGAMVFVDLDNLKYTNDTFGHDMGDRLIIRAAEIFRQFETYGGVVSRISGDEFAIYLHGYEEKAHVRALIQEVFDKNADFSLRTPDGQAQRIRFSAGIAYYPQDSDDVTDLLKLSDYAMYEAKHSQKGSVFEFNMESYRENVYLLENREAINLLLDEKMIRFAYQPIVDLRTGEVFAYEALMRPLLNNFKSPIEILSVAASQSKLAQLEHLVITMAFQTVRDHQQDLGDCKMFINSIPSQTLSSEEHLLLERNYSDLFDRIVIEITEVDDIAPMQLEHKLSFLRKNSIKVAIDDFGSGYSNEIRMLSLIPDIIKVDIELISDIDKNPDKQKLLENLISFCRPKGILMVAEGVERREELQELVRMGIDFVQGYYLARPAFEFVQVSDKVKREILSMQRFRREP